PGAPAGRGRAPGHPGPLRHHREPRPQGGPLGAGAGHAGHERRRAVQPGQPGRLESLVRRQGSD
ncbi:unnamed protein product, partial [Heterosigma akashiwo]